jgi:hypothetical protein
VVRGLKSWEPILGMDHNNAVSIDGPDSSTSRHHTDGSVHAVMTRVTVSVSFEHFN